MSSSFYSEYTARKGMDSDYLEHLRHSELKAGQDSLKVTIQASNMKLIAKNEQLASMGIQAAEAAAKETVDATKAAARATKDAARETIQATEAAAIETVYATEKSTRETIGATEAAAIETVYATEKAAGEVVSSIDLMSQTLEYSIQDTTKALKEAHGIFGRGFASMEVGLGKLSVSINELISLSKTPSQTWALEQFEIARNAIRQGLMPEALEALDHAIGGHGDHTGHKLDYRFHLLKGYVHLGDKQHLDIETIDPSLAKDSFMLAYRYAQADSPIEAGRALCAAGWCEYVMGDFDSALELTVKSSLLLQTNLERLNAQRDKYGFLGEINKTDHSENEARLAESFYQEAKVHIALDNKDGFVDALEKSFILDGSIAIRASSDIAYAYLNTLIYTALEHANAKLKQEILCYGLGEDQRIRQVEKISEKVAQNAGEIIHYNQKKLTFDEKGIEVPAVEMDGEALSVVYATKGQVLCISDANTLIELQNVKREMMYDRNYEHDLSRAVTLAESVFKESERALNIAKTEAESAQLKAEEESRLRVEEESRLKAEEKSRLKAEEESRLKAEEESRLKAEEESRLKAEEESRLKAEKEEAIRLRDEALVKGIEAGVAESKAKARRNKIIVAIGLAMGLVGTYSYYLYSQGIAASLTGSWERVGYCSELRGLEVLEIKAMALGEMKLTLKDKKSKVIENLSALDGSFNADKSLSFVIKDPNGNERALSINGKLTNKGITLQRKSCSIEFKKM